jgi:hypothetical protein
MAIAKLWMLLTDSFADIRVGLPKEILWLSVAFELWLASENFRLSDHRVMAFINTIAFAFFASFAAMRLLLGYQSCGCSGNLEIPAWVFLLIDVGVVAWFASSTSRRNQIASGLWKLVHGWSCWSPEKRGQLAGLGLFASLMFVSQLHVAAPFRAMFFGESPLIATVKMDGELVLEQESRGTVEIWNRSSQPAKIIGLSRSCSCLDFFESPISRRILGNERVIWSVKIKPNKLGTLNQRVELFLDHPKQFRVNVNVFGFVKGVER